MPRILYLAFGGTISSVPSASLGPVEPRLTGVQLLQDLPQVPSSTDIEVVELPQVVSFAMTIDQLHYLARKAASAPREGFDGVVISHGTDTLEETAYALALMIPRTHPVVLTGALRNPSLPSPDGHANLLAAFRVAATAQAASLGPVVVMNDDLHAARFVTKEHTSRLSAFGSPGAGPLGGITEDQVDIWWQPLWEDYLGMPDTLRVGSVELLKMTVDPSDLCFKAAVAEDVAGIVIEGTGGGHVPPNLLSILDDTLRAGVPVVVATRAASGATLKQTYGVPGAEVDLAARGAVHAGRISGPKARLRLLLGMALHREARQLFPVA